MNATSNFLLDKWYLDCVSEEGATFIGYVAHLRWKVVSLWYSSLFLHDGENETHSNTSFHNGSFPLTDGSRIHWSDHSLHVDGDWNALSAPIDRHLYEEEGGSIVWSCLQPSSRCSIKVGKYPRLEGLGYVEHMTLSIPPWQLPLSELRWGRFVTPTDALVWINWNGNAPQSWLFMNGSEVLNCSIKDNEIRMDDNRLLLKLSDSTILRKGPLLTTTLSVIPHVTTLFPSKILRADECKWKSVGHLTSRNIFTASGWAIHELVKF